MNLQWTMAALGAVLVLAGLYFFAKRPRGSGGRTKIKFPGIEAELPVSSLVPMFFGVVLLIIASQVDGEDDAERADRTPIAAATGELRPDPSAQCVPATATSLTSLKWAPSDCSEKSGAPIRIDGCDEQRPLTWLHANLVRLRDANVEGFAGLPDDFELVVADAYGKKNWALQVRSGNKRLYNVGVGYNISSGAKDGCLTLVKSGKPVTPSACMDTSGQWWIRRGPELCVIRTKS